MDTQRNGPDTFSEALEVAQRDYARLLYEHAPTWSLDLSGAVVWTCCCGSPGPRNAAANDQHIKESVRKARGPVRPPKR
jgi:hypothetical protein